MRAILAGIVAVMTFALSAVAQQTQPQQLQVFQNLDEVTSRIPNLPDKPYEKLINAHDGFFQDEVIIFKDVETGKEVWALSREECRDMAHTGRRPAWSANGQFISFTGNMVFINKAQGDKLWKRTWAGYSYVANADGSQKRPIYAMADGKLMQLNSSKYNMWDAAKPNAWYTISGDKLYRVEFGQSVTGNKGEAIYTFPNREPKVIQMISDDNYMLIEESGKSSACYVVNLNKKPDETGFCMTVPLKGIIHSGSFRIRRGQPTIITGGYENLPGGVTLRVEGDKLVPTELPKQEGVEMWHLWNGPPDDRVGYFGKYKDKTGLWVIVPGKEPAMLADVGDGHVTWCGRDPEWFFATVGHSKAKDQKFVGKLLAGNADGKRIEIVCTPFDRQRPGEKNYGSIPLPTQSRDGTKCWFHSSMLLSTNANTGSYIAVFRRPYAPTKLTAQPGVNGGIVLEWQPHEINFEVKGYHVYRSDDGGKIWSELTDEAVAGKSFTDKTATSGVEYVYAVTAEEHSRLESDKTSPTLKVSIDAGEMLRLITTGGQPAGVSGWDKTAPAAATDFKAQLKDGLVNLAWTAPADKDRRYFNIYASSEGKPDISQKRLLVSPTHGQKLYIDWTAPKGKTMHYALTVVDRQGNESAPVYVSCEQAQ